MEINRHRKMRGFPLYIKVFLICLVLFPVVAAGENGGWQLYCTGADGSRHFYDPESIVRSAKIYPGRGGRNVAKFRRRNTKALRVRVRERIVVGNPHDKLIESKVVREFECSTGMFHTLMRSNFYRDGTSRITGQTGVWRDIESDPCIRELYHIVCGKPKRSG